LDGTSYAAGPGIFCELAFGFKSGLFPVPKPQEADAVFVN
jgi:hypothetical protein